MGLWLKQDDGTLVEVSGGSSDGGGTGADGADGKGWTGGTYDAATGVVTFTSDDGLEFTTGDLRGIDGIDGSDGNMWHVGSGAPDASIGEPGDYYLDGEAGWVHVKRNDGSWTNLFVNLTGPPGEGAGEHDHNYAPPHDHPYAATGHTHSYSPTSHTHDKVAGYGVAGGNTPPSGAQVIRSHTNGYTYLGWLNTVSGANTNEPTRIYTNNGGSDSFVRYMTPANFRKKVADFTEFCNPPIRSLNATTKNAGTDYSHTFAATIGGVSLTNAKAVIAQVSVQSAIDGFWNVWRYGGTRPATSSGNFAANTIASNQQVIPIDGSRRMKYRSSQKTSLFIIDVVAVMY